LHHARAARDWSRLIASINFAQVGSRGRLGGYGSPPGYPAADALASQQPPTTSLRTPPTFRSIISSARQPSR
jgi:hypothetical protein